MVRSRSYSRASSCAPRRASTAVLFLAAFAPSYAAAQPAEPAPPPAAPSPEAPAAQPPITPAPAPLPPAPIGTAAPAAAAASGAEAAPATPPAGKEAKPLFGYDKGFFVRTADDRFALHIEARVQLRYAYESLDEDDEREELSSFAIQRARLKLSGHAFTKDLGYAFQTDFGKGFVTLKDFYADYRLVPGWLHVRAGQWKRPFSRQQINSSGNLELVDRAITDKAFGAGRDIGIAVHNDYEKSPELEWALGLFNGTGEEPTFSGTVEEVDPDTGEGKVTKGKFTNVPSMFRPAAVARLGYNYGGIKGYSEADLEGGPFRFAIAGSGLARFDAANDDDSAIQGEIDTIVKVEGFSALAAGYVESAQNGGGFGDREVSAVGGHAQVGYVIAKRVQPVLRYAIVYDPRSSTSQHEPAFGVGVYVFKHNLKWQTDGGPLIEKDPDGKRVDYRVRSQVQLAF